MEKIVWQSTLTESQVKGVDVDELIYELNKAVQAVCQDLGVSND